MPPNIGCYPVYLGMPVQIQFYVGAIEDLQVALVSAKVEGDVQSATITFFGVLLKEFQSDFFVRDTSFKGLKNPMAKPDIVLLAENEASWVQSQCPLGHF